MISKLSRAGIRNGWYRADFKLFLPHGSGHVLAVRQNNWVTSSTPAVAQATVILRSYKFGEYLAPYHVVD
jgi:hypothetical protein